MKKIEVFFRGLAATTGKRAAAVIFIGLSAPIASGQGLLTNGDFGSGLDGWKTEGLVLADGGVGTLNEGAAAPVLYQPVSVSGYVYELRFDLDLSGLSAGAGTGQLDRARLVLYLGTDAASLTPDGAVDEAVLIEADSSGLLSVAQNAQVVANAALGAGWYSAVVEMISDFEAIAPACRLIDGNGSADSSMGIDNVVLRALDRGRFANISNRGGVGTGANVMIPGFVIDGPTNKALVIRGSGPTLGELGVPGTITDPQLKLYYKPPGQPPPPDELKAENDNWEDAANLDALKAAMALVGAFEFREGNLDAAFLVEDLVPGAYTVEVSGVGGVTGVALAEVYDLGASADGPTELVNISNRGFVGTGSSVQIPGFVIRGNRGRVVLVRAVGPTLGGFGVVGTIEDPFLNLYDLTDPTTPLFSNDNWEEAVNTTEVEATAARVGAFPLGAGSKDASILASLPPGNYTAVAKGVDGATGVALVEVYVVTDNQRPTAYGNSLVVTSDVANILPMDEILGDDTDPENDVLSVSFFTQPDVGTISMNDDGELVYTSPADFFGETAFSYRASDGEYESVPATIYLDVRIAGTLVWQGGSSENFSDPANWVGGAAPGVDDPVWIAPEGGGIVVLDANTEVGSIWAGDSDSAVTLKTNNKNLTVAGGLKVQPGSTFELDGGTLDTTQDAIIAGQLIWRTGTMTGDAATVIAEGASASLPYNTAYLRGGRDLINKGTLTQTDGGSIVSDTAGATSTITNASGATWEANLDANKSIAIPNNSTARLDFVNDGTLIKGGTGSNNLGYNTGAFDFTNNGTLNVEAGTLRMETNGAMNLGGQVKQESGTVLGFYRGSATISGTLEQGSGSVLLVDYNARLTLPAGAELTGDGILRVGQGSITLSDPYTLPSVVFANGTLTANSGLTVGDLMLTSGSLSATGDVTVTGTLEWGGTASMTGEGATIIADGATASVGTNRVYLRGGRDLINRGTLTQTGQSSIIQDTAGASSTITNAAGAQWTVDMVTNNSIAYPSVSGATLDFVNEGTLTKSGTGSNTLGNNTGAFNFTNSGILNIDGGTLRLEAIGTMNLGGRVKQASGTVLGFYRGTATISGTLERGSGSALLVDYWPAALTLASGVELTGDGALHVVSGSATLTADTAFTSVVINSATLVADGALTVGDLTQTSGTLSGTGDVTVTGTLVWSGGSMSGDAATIIADGATASLPGRVYLRGGRDLINNGTLTQTGQSSIIQDTAGASSTITNASGAQWTVNMEANKNFAYALTSATLDFVNDGTLTKSGAGLTNLGATTGAFNLTNNGALEINAGTLNIIGTSAVLSATGTVRLTTDGSIKPLIRPGALTIGGALEVILADGYNPANGTTIRLIDYTSKTGEFSAITPPQGRTIVEAYASDGLDVTID